MYQKHEQMVYTCSHTLIANKYMKRCSTSLIIKIKHNRNKMPIFTIRMAKIKFGSYLHRQSCSESVILNSPWWELKLIQNFRN